MELAAVFGVIAAVLGIGFLSEIVFRKTNIPDVVFLIGIGIILGPILQWTAPSDFPGASIFTTFALIFLIFQGALNINFHELWESLSNTVRLTIGGFLISVIVVTGIAMIFGFSLLTSLLLGMMLGGTSSAVVIPMVTNLKMDEKAKIVLMLESAITDVLCIVGAITVIGIIKNGEIAPRLIFNSLFLSFGVAIIIGSIIGLLWIVLLHEFENLTHAYMVTIAAVIGTYALVEAGFGASGAIAALAFGLVLGNSHQILKKMFKHNIHHHIKFTSQSDIAVIRDVLSPSARTFYSEISFFVKVFFFVYIGILMDFTKPHVFVFAGVLTLVMFLARPWAVKLVYGRHTHQRERIIMEVMSPKGLAPVVLVQLAIQQGVSGANNLLLPILSTVLLSIILTSLLIFLTEHKLFKGFWVPLKRHKEAG